MIKAYRYKLEPNKAQRYALARTLDICRELYNDALQQRKMRPISQFEQSRQLTELKAVFPVYSNVYVHVLQNVLKDSIVRLRTSFGVARKVVSRGSHALRAPTDTTRLRSIMRALS